ncbi:MAG: hypothetical protein IKK33_11875 [Lachnospiraceae bacterium]|nr:hypothetical protein [Lachnospiraceae bacterium]
MKKLVLTVLALTLAFSMTACGNKEEQAPEATPNPTEAPVATEAPEATEVPEVTEAPEATDAPQEDGNQGEVSGESLGQTLLAEFMAMDASTDAYTMAETLITNEKILFMGGAMEVEPGLLSGFDNYEVTGFDKGAMFGPMMGSIAFVGYIFELPEGADADAFMTGLKDNANPRWQICVAADETIVEANGNKVFFLMSPLTLEQ